MKNLQVIFDEINKREILNRGKIVAVEPESGDYFIGKNVIEAYKLAVRKYPSKKFVFRRIGFISTYFIGAS